MAAPSPELIPSNEADKVFCLSVCLSVVLFLDSWFRIFILRFGCYCFFKALRSLLRRSGRLGDSWKRSRHGILGNAPLGKILGRNSGKRRSWPDRTIAQGRILGTPIPPPPEEEEEEEEEVPHPHPSDHSHPLPFLSPSPCSFPPSRPMTSSRPWRQ